ncbi:MAG: hypothetical protein HZA92_14680 [Verrucomicrobia bacterium]|nr:hypothetical protein [Verrucomicrobiota bacterium]
MNATLHLFRNDVRRLRWWLVAWVGFLVGVHLFGHWLVGQQSRLTSPEWLGNFVRRQTVTVVLLLAFQATLAALLLVPHGPDDPRLFWRTRPIAPRDMVRAKFLFAGLFLIALPMLVESVFWLGWLRLRDIAAFWPGMLLERAAWSVFFVAGVTLGGREGKRYLFCVAGVLGLFGSWMLVGEELAMRARGAYGDEHWPVLTSPHLLGQVVEYYTKNTPVVVGLSMRTARIPLVVLAVAGWLVVLCRYLFPGWRATRLAIETGMLVCLATAFVLGEIPWQERRAEVNALAHAEGMRLERAVETLTVRLKSARRVPTREMAGKGEVPRIEFGSSGATEFTWETEGAAPGTIVFSGIGRLDKGYSLTATNYLPGGAQVGLANRHVGYYASVASNQLVAALPELAGYRLHATRWRSWHWAQMRPELAAELTVRPQIVTAEVVLGVVAPRTLAVLPVRQGASEWMGTTRIRLTGAPRFGVKVIGNAQEITQYVQDTTSEEPNLFLLRNSRTKEAFPVRREELEGDAGRHSEAVVHAPLNGIRGVWIALMECDLTKAAARHGFSAEWVAESELLCVRLTLVGKGTRQLRLENFQLQPAAER